MPSLRKAFLWCLPVVLAVVVYRRLSFVGDSGYGFSSTADEVAAEINLSGQTALVTGATGGLGFETARVLAERGAHVYVGGRTLHKASQAVIAIREEAHAVSPEHLKLTPVACSLGSLADAQACAVTFEGSEERLEILVLNAGIAWVTSPSTTPDGFEKTMGVNHLAHFHLTMALLPRVLAAESPRVVVLSSSAHGMSSAKVMADPTLGMSGLLDGSRSWLAGAPAYGDSKLANALFAKELHNRYSGRGLLAFSVDPGEILTGIVKPSEAWFPWVLQKVGTLVEPLLLKTPAQGAATQVYCALRAPASQSGGFFRNSNLDQLDMAPLRALLEDAEATGQFWRTSELLVRGAL